MPSWRAEGQFWAREEDKGFVKTMMNYGATVKLKTLYGNKDKILREYKITYTLEKSYQRVLWCYGKSLEPYFIDNNNNKAIYMFLKFINMPVFLLSLAVGTLFVYLSTPLPKVSEKFQLVPTSEIVSAPYCLNCSPYWLTPGALGRL